ncbi:MAG: lactate racemase domain-containing protein [Myxococcota bacterium]
MTRASIKLPYGHAPYIVRLPEHLTATIVGPPAEPAGNDPAQSVAALIERALDEPIAAPRLGEVIAPGQRVLIAVSDATRDDPRDLMLRSLLARMPESIELTIAVANGTHGRSELARLGIGDDLWQRATIVNHDVHDPASEDEMITIGTTARGTPVRLHRSAVEADWLIATGRIKPHYFAGYGAGCKSIFPGLGSNREIRINHELKRQPGARPGVVDGNPCRDDLEEAVAMLPGRTYLLNVVVDHQGQGRAAVAGDLRQAFRRGAALCEPYFKVRAPRADVVIASDHLPLTGSLYQASKLVAGVAPLVKPGGTVILVAECPEGIGPIDTVNRAIYEIGVKPRLPEQHRVVLISGLTEDQVAPSYCDWAPSAEVAVEQVLQSSPNASLTVVTRAGILIVEPTTEHGSSSSVSSG